MIARLAVSLARVGREEVARALGTLNGIQLVKTPMKHLKFMGTRPEWLLDVRI
jgi:hypothetical protein